MAEVLRQQGRDDGRQLIRPRGHEDKQAALLQQLKRRPVDELADGVHRRQTHEGDHLERVARRALQGLQVGFEHGAQPGAPQHPGRDPALAGASRTSFPSRRQASTRAHASPVLPPDRPKTLLIVSASTGPPR